MGNYITDKKQIKSIDYSFMPGCPPSMWVSDRISFKNGQCYRGKNKVGKIKKIDTLHGVAIVKDKKGSKHRFNSDYFKSPNIFYALTKDEEIQS